MLESGIFLSSYYTMKKLETRKLYYNAFHNRLQFQGNTDISNITCQRRKYKHILRHTGEEYFLEHGLFWCFLFLFCLVNCVLFNQRTFF